MTDLLIGRTISATNFPATKFAATATDISNVSSTSFINGSPEISVTFIAPLSGRVLIVNGAGLGDNGGSPAQMFVDSEVRVTDGAGAVVRSSNVAGEGTISSAAENASNEYKSRAYVLSDLTPGQQYFARLQYRAATVNGGTGDVTARSILVQPIA